MDDLVLRVQWSLDLSLAPSLLPYKAPWTVMNSKEGSPGSCSNCPPHSDPRCLVCANSAQYVGPHPQNMAHKSLVQCLPRAASCFWIISEWTKRQVQPAGGIWGRGGIQAPVAPTPPDLSTCPPPSTGSHPVISLKVTPQLHLSRDLLPLC